MLFLKTFCNKLKACDFKPRFQISGFIIYRVFYVIFCNIMPLCGFGKNKADQLKEKGVLKDDSLDLAKYLCCISLIFYFIL